MVFTQAFVLEETQQVSSTASGLEELFLPDNTGNARANPGMSWLVEPKRASVVTKFSGTLTHGTSHLSSVQAKTVFAFAHFAYVYSKRTVAFADFQGELDRSLDSLPRQTQLILRSRYTSTRQRSRSEGVQCAL